MPHPQPSPHDKATPDQLREACRIIFDPKGNNPETIFPQHGMVVVGNLVHFEIQRGAKKEVGVNGCDPIALLELSEAIYQYLEKKLPCAENKKTIRLIGEAITEQRNRTADREKREVEGTLKG